MDSFINYYAAGDSHPFIMLIVFWLFWPGLAFIVAPIFESHKVYLGKGQSRLFFPGDFLLGIMTISLVGLCARNRIGWGFFHSVDYWYALNAVMFILAGIGRSIDVQRYPKGSRESPTKFVHDFCGYYLCSFFIIGLGVPQIAWTIANPATFMPNIGLWRIFIMALLVFGLLGLHDITHLPTPEQLLLRHPDKYKPCWKK